MSGKDPKRHEAAAAEVNREVTVLEPSAPGLFAKGKVDPSEAGRKGAQSTRRALARTSEPDARGADDRWHRRLSRRSVASSTGTRHQTDSLPPRLYLIGLAWERT